MTTDLWAKRCLTGFMFEVVAGSVTEPILCPSRKLTLLPTDGLEVLFGRWNIMDFALGIPLVSAAVYPHGSNAPCRTNASPSSVSCFLSSVCQLSSFSWIYYISLISRSFSHRLNAFVCHFCILSFTFHCYLHSVVTFFLHSRHFQSSVLFLTSLTLLFNLPFFPSPA